MFELYHDILQPYYCEDNLILLYRDTEYFIQSHTPKTVPKIGDLKASKIVIDMIFAL